MTPDYEEFKQAFLERVKTCLISRAEGHSVIHYGCVSKLSGMCSAVEALGLADLGLWCEKEVEKAEL